MAKIVDTVGEELALLPLERSPCLTRYLQYVPDKFDVVLV